MSENTYLFVYNPELAASYAEGNHATRPAVVVNIEDSATTARLDQLKEEVGSLRIDVDELKEQVQQNPSVEAAAIDETSLLALVPDKMDSEVQMNSFSKNLDGFIRVRRDAMHLQIVSCGGVDMMS